LDVFMSGEYVQNVKIRGEYYEKSLNYREYVICISARV